jgi:hypothetical protein
VGRDPGNTEWQRDLSVSYEKVGDMQGLLRHSRMATTTDVYMQEIPESVQATINSINSELRKERPVRSRKRSPKPTAPVDRNSWKRSAVSNRVVRDLTPSWKEGSL